MTLSLSLFRRSTKCLRGKRWVDIDLEIAVFSDWSTGYSAEDEELNGLRSAERDQLITMV